jgi:signal transduction histidine kinase
MIKNHKINDQAWESLIVFDEQFSLIQITKSARAFFKGLNITKESEIESYIFNSLFKLKEKSFTENSLLSLETSQNLFRLATINLINERLHLLEIIDKIDPANNPIQSQSIRPIIFGHNQDLICKMNFSTGDIDGTQNLMQSLEVPAGSKCTILKFRDSYYCGEKEKFDLLYSKVIDKIKENEIVKSEIQLESVSNKQYHFTGCFIGYVNKKNETNVITIFKDNVEQKVAPKRQTELESFYQELLDVRLNKDFKITYANSNFLKIIGYENKPLDKVEFNNHILNFDEHYSASINDAIKNKIKKISFPCFLKGKNNSLHSVYISVTSSLNKEAYQYNILMLQLNTGLDLSSQLENSYYRLKTLVMKLKLGVLVEKPGRIIDFANKTFCELFKIPVEPSDLIGLSCANAAQETAPMFKNSAEFIERIETILKENKPVFGELVELKSGKIYSRDYIPLNNSDSGSSDSNGLIWQYQDVTETIKTEKSLKVNLDKEKGLTNAISSLVSTASHQLRTPISVVDSNIQLLQEIMPEQTPMQQRIFDRINKEFSRFRMLLDDILIVEKLRAGKVQASLEKKDIIPIINELKTRSFEPYIDGRSLHLTVTGKAKPVFIDQHLFEAVILNLTFNAFKYSPLKKSPKIRVKFEKSEVNIEIEDFGVGVPKKEQEKLFSNFFRASNARSFQGSGLGLSIAKEYLTRMSGTISFTSKVNVGSCFRIKFPISS